MSEDLETLRQWIGKREVSEDLLAPIQVAALEALLDRDPEAVTPDADLPPVGHWLYFLLHVRQSQLGRDGHPVRGDFLPPVELPRRMYAGSRIRYERPLRVGQVVKRTATIEDVSIKTGATGELVFITAAYAYEGPDGPALREEQDIVYRHDPSPDAPPPKAKPAPADADWEKSLVPDPVLLFRYSSLISNSHRIHYDEPYVTQVEKYPGLIVHGPLTATLMIEAFREQHPQAVITEFDFRAVSPLICGREMAVAGARRNGDGEADLWARNDAGELSMTGRVAWR